MISLANSMTTKDHLLTFRQGGLTVLSVTRFRHSDDDRLRSGVKEAVRLQVLRCREDALAQHADDEVDFGLAQRQGW